jgi:hypothetical protein
MTTTINFPEIQIADAMNCTAEDIKVYCIEDWFSSPDGCTVTVNNTPIDCYFTNGKLSLILNANTGEKVYAI